MFRNRDEVTEAIVLARIHAGLSWAEVASRLGLSKEWVTAACLGQMTFSAEQADALCGILQIDPAAKPFLTRPPMKGTFNGRPPDDPLLYRFYEMLSVYGPAIKELIAEEFGDGIMSAIDFSMDLQRELDPKGDRVRILLSGKFLPYKVF